MRVLALLFLLSFYFSCLIYFPGGNHISKFDGYLFSPFYIDIYVFYFILL